MAEITNTSIIGNHSVRPTEYSTDEQLFTLKRYDKALGAVGHDRMHFAPASIFVWSLYVLTTANNNTKSSVAVRAPFPLTIWAAQVGCESAASTAGTVDILTQPAAGGGYTTILDAPEDVKTAAGTVSHVAPEVDSEDMAYNDFVRCDQIASSAADMVGGQAHLICQRL